MLAANMNVSKATVAKTYFVQDSVARKMTMLASTAMRLPRAVLKTLGEIMNSEHPDLVASANECESNGNDCRVFRDFVKLYSLYNCSSFMNGTADIDLKAKVNTLYRAKEIC